MKRKIWINHRDKPGVAKKNRGVGYRVRPSIRRYLARSYGGECYWCGLALGVESITIDHIVPVSKGGLLDSSSNVVAACRSCNEERGNRKYPHAVMVMSCGHLEAHRALLKSVSPRELNKRLRDSGVIVGIGCTVEYYRAKGIGGFVHGYGQEC